MFRIFSLNVLSLKSEAPSEMHFESSGEPNDLVKEMESILWKKKKKKKHILCNRM